MTATDQQNENKLMAFGNVYVAVDGSSCDECFFDTFGCSPIDSPSCAASRRADGREIIWKIKEDQVMQPEHNNDAATDKSRNEEILDYNKGVWFQSAGSGAWYMSYKSAGEIMAVKIDGKIFTPAA